ncbi:MAG: hypothetical protein P1U82_24095 [Verrucomicrobiales bacterium]|nr:hypothetical protein [Verrucomicrobiales bacterium]
MSGINQSLSLIAWLLIGSAPAFSEDRSLHIGETQNISGDGTMVVCHYPKDSGKPIDLLVHFHGMASVAAANFEKLNWKGALVVINFKGLSAAYAKPFREDSALLESVLEQAAKTVGPETICRSLTVSSFSAGYGAVREILKTPKFFERIDALIAADSMYASLEKDRETRQPLETHMRDYLRFAKLASDGKKTFIITHSSQETPYASTTETANALLQALDINREQSAQPSTAPLKLSTKAIKGKFTVFGYDGISGEDHLHHLRHIHLWWSHSRS